jgi:hypothetical protein
MPPKPRSRTGSYLPILVIGAGLVTLSLALLLGIRRSGPSTMSTPLPSLSEEETFPEIPRVPLDEAKDAFDAQSAVFVDVRDSDLYVASHIPDALSVPLADLAGRLTELSPSDWIITYCT